MVFQSYALYPQLDVAANMGFALKQQGVPKEERNQRVREAAKLLDLEPYLDRKPRNLSGGQRQRVAMGRAIVRHPQVYLDGRAALEPRREAARADAHRARRAAAAARRDDRLRDPRPGRGDDDGRPRRGAARRRPAAVRHAGDALPRAGQPVRRRIHRLAGDEPAARRANRAGRDRRRQNRRRRRSRRRPDNHRLPPRRSRCRQRLDPGAHPRCRGPRIRSVRRVHGAIHLFDTSEARRATVTV